MCSLPNNESICIELPQLQLDVDDTNGRHQRTQWLLNSPEPPSFCNELKESVLPQKNNFFRSNSKPCRAGVFSFLQGLFPILSWGRNYKATMFKHDLLSGLTLASLCIPQSIGYANLANLDPQYGLYTSVVPPLIYAVMGSSRELAIGPVAVVSLLLSAMITEIVDPTVDPIAYTSLVFTVTFFAGIFQAAFGLLRLGFLVDFLSHAAIVGFMGGAAIIIGLQQLKGLIGITHFTNKTDVVSVLKAVFRSFHDEALSPLNFILGCSFLIFILVTRFIGKRNKKLFWLPAIAPLLSVIVSTLMVYLTKADQHGVKIVKHFKGGLNPSSVHQLQFNGPHLGEVAKIGLITALVALTEAIAVGRSFASMNGYHLDGNKEMVAMGFMNIVGSLTSCYTATGSFSRTAVNFSAGCETVLSNIVMAITVFISLELLTKLLYYTPLAILASVILSALPGLIDINEAYHIWKVDKMDFIVCIGAFFGVMFVSVEIGLLVAVSISFARIILDTIQASTEVQGRLPGTTDTFCDITQYPGATRTSGILIIRINSGSLCFANATSIRERVLKLVTHTDDSEENTKEKVHFLVLDISNVMSVDTSGIVMLEELHRELVSQSIQLTIANPRLRVINKMKTAKCFDKLGKEWIFLTIGDAVDACSSLKIADHSSTNC
ncbi:low affinity sulfate transporter 3-like [Lycium ferocissimum]|uniref:low affinity sulfate transporter 3-like n=1 Tax=Lycium ferocissimum TaxID=112874 RepID=UPI002814D4AA|nr:low affinity sulfate transporter 3-like [Lycium ferocissimum]